MEETLQQLIVKVNTIESDLERFMASLELDVVEPGTGGIGDMLKSTYDTDNDGFVDYAETAPWTGISGKPSTFPPEIHNHYHHDLLELGDDDHPHYLNVTRHDITDRHTLGTVVPHDDHGLLSGLLDDDHTQYLNALRHDTTDRHTIGTVVPHDDHENLGGLDADDHLHYLNITRHDVTSRHALGTVVPHDDHGLLSGLTDDDHSQYLNNTRHDTTLRHGSFVVDHGSIGGLTDDDHPQYFPCDASRTIEGDIIPGQSGAHDLGSVSNQWGNIWSNTLNTQVFAKSYTTLTNGSLSIVPDVVELTQDLHQDSGVVYLIGASLEIGDIIYFKTVAYSEAMRVEYKWGGGKYQVTRAIDGEIARPFPAGTIGAVYGSTGAGRAIIDSVGPRISLYKRTGSTSLFDEAEFIRLGFLQGWGGIGGSKYGIGIGDSNAYMRYIMEDNSLTVRGRIEALEGNIDDIELTGTLSLKYDGSYYNGRIESTNDRIVIEPTGKIEFHSELFDGNEISFYSPGPWGDKYARIRHDLYDDPTFGHSHLYLTNYANDYPGSYVGVGTFGPNDTDGTFRSQLNLFTNKDSHRSTAQLEIAETDGVNDIEREFTLNINHVNGQNDELFTNFQRIILHGRDEHDGIFPDDPDWKGVYSLRAYTSAEGLQVSEYSTEDPTTILWKHRLLNADSNGWYDTPYGGTASKLMVARDYDTDEDGKVDAAEEADNAALLQGLAASAFAPSGFGLGGAAAYISNQDLNALITTGFYQGNNLTNAPNGSTGWFYVAVIANDHTYTLQQAYDWFADKVYFRRLHNSVWQPWVGFRHTRSPACVCKVRRNSAQSIAHNTWSSVAFNAQLEDDEHNHWTSGSQVYFREAGTYLVIGQLSMLANASGSKRYGALRINGTTWIGIQSLPNEATNVQNHNFNIASFATVGASDYVELMGYQDSGGSLGLLIETTTELHNTLKMIRMY